MSSVDTISIIGQGKMGQALNDYFEKQAIPLQWIGRQPERLSGSILILALPYDSLEEVIENYEDQLDGVIVVDISNPMDYQKKESLLPPEESVAINLAQRFPRLTFLKAFNTNFSSSRVAAQEQPTVLVAGDDQIAKDKVAALFSQAELTVLDIGSLEKSRDLEAFARIQLHLLEAANTALLEGFAL